MVIERKMNISNYNNALAPLYWYNETSMIITKNNNNNIYTYKHTTTQTEEEHVADETKQIINLICQDVESFMKTNEHEFIISVVYVNIFINFL